MNPATAHRGRRRRPGRREQSRGGRDRAGPGVVHPSAPQDSQTSDRLPDPVDGQRPGRRTGARGTANSVNSHQHGARKHSRADITGEIDGAAGTAGSRRSASTAPAHTGATVSATCSPG